jgi:hypothetical protein
MRTIEIPLIDKNQFFPFDDRNLPGFEWLEKLYNALKPLSGFRLINGKEALMIWVRVGSNGSQPVEAHGKYGQCDYEAELSTPTIHGWWVMTIELLFTDEDGNDLEASKIKFYSSDFNVPEIIQNNFSEVLQHLQRQAAVPTFDPQRIARALAVLAEE